jgi:hypothetical protein
MTALQTQTIVFEDKFFDESNTKGTSGIIALLDADGRVILCNPERKQMEVEIQKMVNSPRYFCLQDIDLYADYDWGTTQFAGLVVKNLKATPGLENCISHLVFSDEQARDSTHIRWRNALL